MTEIPTARDMILSLCRSIIKLVAKLKMMKEITAVPVK
jgi:hypothetical protein